MIILSRSKLYGIWNPSKWVATVLDKHILTMIWNNKGALKIFFTSLRILNVKEK